MNLLKYLWPSKKELHKTIEQTRHNRERLRTLHAQYSGSSFANIIEATDEAAEFDR